MTDCAKCGLPTYDCTCPWCDTCDKDLDHCTCSDGEEDPK